MLGRIIRREDWAAKYRATFGGPLVDAYAGALLERGYPRHSIKHILRDGKEFADWAKTHGRSLSTLDDATLARFDARNARRAPSHKLRVALRCNARHLLAFLRERGIAPPPAEAEERPLREFEEWMAVHRGSDDVDHRSLLVCAPSSGASPAWTRTA
jgi:hypothetical protein